LLASGGLAVCIVLDVEAAYGLFMTWRMNARSWANRCPYMFLAISILLWPTAQRSLCRRKAGALPAPVAPLRGRFASLRARDDVVDYPLQRPGGIDGDRLRG
jgi:hypothetical protein